MTIGAVCLLIAGGVTSAPAADQPQAVDFGRDVLPILQRSCFECHGKEKREGGLRLDSREALNKGGDSGSVTAAGKPEDSELLRRVMLPKGSDGIMPARGEPLSASQIGILRSWIKAGAEWPAHVEVQKHWSLQKPRRPALPEAVQKDRVRNAIDLFVQRRLKQDGLALSPLADPVTLARRLHLDLIGLPPSPAEVDAFLNEVRRGSLDEAYQKRVDELLDSPQFGVRWARPWLDYARYADSHGFQRDDFRDLWPYRDWVVSALNADMPFDQFTIEQLAGDLLPNATESQRIATGFNRSAPTNVEAGSDPEETRVNQVLDRVNTLGMTWLGTTLECCQCHDHKYDPFTMRDYYGLFAFFNNTALEADRSNPNVPGSIRFLGPEMKLADTELDRRRTALQTSIKELQSQLEARRTILEAVDPEWEAALLRRSKEASQEHLLTVTDFDSLGGATHEVLPDGSVLLSGEAPDKDTYTITVATKVTGIRAIRLETLTHDSLPGKGPGRGDAQRPNFVLNTFAMTAARSDGGDSAPVRFNKATADFSQAKYDPAGAIDDDLKTAWAINPKFHEPHWARFELAEPIGFDGGTTLTFQLVQNFGSSRTIGRLRLVALTGMLDGETLPTELVEALKANPAKRSAKQKQTIATFRSHADQESNEWQQSLKKLETEVAELPPRTTLVMREQDQPRMSAIFQRGDFRNPGAAVEPHVPASLHPLRRAKQSNASPKLLTRLDLAHWLVDADNPLAARVTVNRWWAELFGQGLVSTPEDFGIKGEPPTHPELLDWLAVEFIEHGWSMKHVLRTIVMSETYRQSSRLDATHQAARDVDPANRLLWHAPRFRMDAEMIRDNALSVAGLVSLKLNGPPVRPYQPDGLWVKVGGQRYDYVVSPGDERYRRGLFVVWKRGAPYPSFINFDANNRFTCRVKRPRSNTPLQALTLMNDPVYVEAAMAFARRILTEQISADVDERLKRAVRLAVAREPKPRELDVLRELLKTQRDANQSDPKRVKEFIGAFDIPAGTSPADFAAWYAVAATLLNLDETITRN